MKKSIFFFAAFMIIAASLQTNLHAQDYYYWYMGGKISLEKGNQQYILFYGDLLNGLDKAQVTYTGNANYEEAPNLMWGVTQADAVIEDMEHILYQISSFRSKQGNNDFFVSHRFSVKLKDEKDLSILESMANQYNVEFDGTSLPLPPRWYLMRWGLNCKYNALELANIFYESGLFEASEPNFLGGLELLGPQANPQVSTNPAQKSVKTIRDGQLIIERGGKTFNAIGQIIQ